VNLKTPVLFLIFNRPATTQRVFDAIRQAKPSRLFVAADGPRDDIPNEVEKCEQTRRIIDTVDWGCEVTCYFREKNLGCRKAVSSAIDWFFLHVDEGIILEDDCLPSQTFFRYCQELLEYYRNDMRIMQICGLNVLKEWNRNGHSYYFSNYGPIWGWASWRRAWDYYDVDMKFWPEVREKKFYKDLFLNSEEAEYRLDIYDKVYSGIIDTWDYQWGFAKAINHGLSVIPSLNLIANIGFTVDATHTVTDQNNPYATMEAFNMNTILDHPQYVVRDCLADQRYVREFMGVKPVRNKLEKLLTHLRFRET